MERRKSLLATRLPPIRHPISTAVQPTQSTNPLTTHPSPKGQIRRSHRLKPEPPGVRSAGGGGQIGPPTTRQAAISSERNAPTPPDRAGARPDAILCRKKFKKYQRKKKRVGRRGERAREIGAVGCSHRRRGDGDRQGSRRRPDSWPREARGGDGGGGGGGERKAQELWRRSCSSRLYRLVSG
jgi:hypothetical protein